MLVGSVPAGMLWAYALCSLGCLLLRPLEHRYPILLSRKAILCPLLCTASALWAYSAASDYYHTNVIIPFTERYLPEGIKNGF